MKKSLGLKICAGIAVVSALAFLPTANTYADTLSVGGENLFKAGPNSEQPNDDLTATYKGDSKVLILDGYKGGMISTDIEGLTIKVVDDSEITSTSTAIKSTGQVTISVDKGKTLKSSGNFTISEGLTVSTGTVDLGTKNIEVTDGNIKFSEGSYIKAANITLNDTDKTSQAKITIDNGATVEVTGAIKANYKFATEEKGIELGKNLCTAPAAEVENVAASTTNKSNISTTFTTSSFKSGISNGIKISSEGCSSKIVDEDGNEVENPETLDMIYVYAAILVASSAILGYRRYIAKR